MDENQTEQIILSCCGYSMAGAKKKEREFERWPLYRAAYVRAFKRLLAERNKRGRDALVDVRKRKG